MDLTQQSQSALADATSVVTMVHKHAHTHTHMHQILLQCFSTVVQMLVCLVVDENASDPVLELK